MWVAITVAAVALGCGGGGESGGAPPASAPASAAAAPAASMEAPTGPVDIALADRGKGLFQSKGCIGCHTIGGGKLTGPDLQGLTERREFGWIISMITKPDSMIKSDPVARQLFTEYMTPMTNMMVTDEEARALYEHLRRGTP